MCTKTADAAYVNFITCSENIWAMKSEENDKSRKQVRTFFIAKVCMMTKIICYFMVTIAIVNMGIASAQNYQSQDYIQPRYAPQAPAYRAQPLYGFTEPIGNYGTYFVAFTQGYAASKGYTLTPKLQNMLFRRINAKFETLRADRNRRINAEINLMKYIDVMIEFQRVSPGTLPGRLAYLGDNSYREALAKLCPIWPLCDE